MLLPLWLCCVLPAVLPPAAPPLPPALPETILAAPVNLTWAANHAQAFRDRSFAGFVVHGVAAGPGADPDAPPRRLQDAALRREVRAAVLRLKDAGLPHHFLHVALVPEEAWFADPAAARAALRFFQAAGAFCRETGLAGLALDTQSVSPLHHPRWDGYPLDPGGADRVRAGARRFAERALRAFIREMPAADVLIVADDLEFAGPLWFEFFAGLVQAPGAADTVRLHLVPRAAARRPDPRALQRVRGEFQAWLDDRLDTGTAQRWRDHGALALAVAPLGYVDGLPVAYLPHEEARLQFAAAQLLSDRYVWLDAPEGGWWSVPPEDVVRYAHLRQDGPAAVGAVRPLHPLWAKYSVQSPLAGLTRVGPWPEAHGAIDVLAGSRGAAALFWDGLDRPLSIPSRFASALVTDLRTGGRSELFPVAGKIEVPPSPAPLLLDGLPHADWTLPAGLWVAPEHRPHSGDRGVRLRYGWHNATMQPLAGALALETPPQFGAGAAVHAIDVPPGGDTRHGGHILGRLSPGEPVELRVTLTLPGDRLVGRELSIPVEPAPAWRHPMDGSLALGPPCRYTNAVGRDRVLAGSAGGDFGVFEADGSPVWRQRLRDPLAVAPVPVLLAPARPGVFVVDQRGRARLYDEQGRLRWEHALPAAPAPGGVLAGDLFLADFDGVLVAPPGAPLHCLLPNGDRFWTAPIEGPLRLARFDPARAGGSVPPYAGNVAIGQRIFAVRAGGGEAPGGDLHRLDPMGHLLWRRTFPGAPSADPLVFPLHHESEFAVAVGTSDGAVHVWNADHGMPRAGWAPPATAPVAALIAADVDPAPGLEILVVGPAGIWVLDQDLDLLRLLPIPGALAASPCRIMGEECLLVVDTTGALHAVDHRGQPRWRADLGVSTPVLVLPGSRARHSAAVFGTLTNTLRAMDLGLPHAGSLPAAAPVQGPE